MTPELTLGAIVIVPVAILLLLRVNATLVFLSLCLGSGLVPFVLGDADAFLTLLSTSNATSEINTSEENIKLLLLLLPVVLTTIFMIKTIHGKSRLILNILPAIGVGLLGALLVVPLLPPELSQEIIDSSLWEQVLKVQNIIVGASAVVCLIVLWLQRPKAGHDKHHKKH